MLDIMLPFWGEPRYLFQTVASVLAQTDDDWRLTVVDDCYPDDSVPRFFASLDDPRVRYVRNSQNLGITANYAKCISLASAELVMLMGCDDLLHPDYVQRIHADHVRFPQADIIQPGVQIVDSAGNRVSPFVDIVKQQLMMPRTKLPMIISGEALATSLLRADWLYWPSLVFRRELLVGTPFRKGFPIIQDLALVIDMVVKGANLLLDPHVCFSYRRHEASASSAALFDGRRFSGEEEYFRVAATIVSRNGWQRARRAAVCHSTSRIHAAVLVPKALGSKNLSAARALAAHVVSFSFRAEQE